MINIDLVLDETEETAPETEETAPALDLEGTTDLNEDQLVPRRRRPTLRDRDSERSVARSASRAFDDRPLWPTQGPVTRAASTSTTSMPPKLVVPGAAGTVPPVLVPLADKQLEVAQISEGQAAAYGIGKDAFQLVKGAGHFPLASGEPGASHAAMQGVSTIVDIMRAYHLLCIGSEDRAQLLVQAAFSADCRHVWNCAWSKAPTSTTGYREGSQLFCVLRNLLVAFTTIAEKQRILDAKSAFGYSS